MIPKVGWLVRSMIKDLGQTVLFFLDVLRAMKGARWQTYPIVEQVYAVGVRSFSTTLVTGLFVGAIMAIQINLQLRDFGAQGFLGGLTSSVTIRNIGPVLIAFILSGKVGAYTSAEIATMKVTDQISAIRCLGTDPIRYLVVPRMIAVVVSSFLLLITGLMMTIAGGALISGLYLGVNSLNYIKNIPNLVTWWSVWEGVLKSFVFGLIIGILACYRGYTATGGSRGVGKSVKGAAVSTLVWIIIANYTLSWLGSKAYESIYAFSDYFDAWIGFLPSEMNGYCQKLTGFWTRACGVAGL